MPVLIESNNATRIYSDYTEYINNVLNIENYEIEFFKNIDLEELYNIKYIPYKKEYILLIKNNSYSVYKVNVDSWMLFGSTVSYKLISKFTTSTINPIIIPTNLKNDMDKVNSDKIGKYITSTNIKLYPNPKRISPISKKYYNKRGWYDRVYRPISPIQKRKHIRRPITLKYMYR